MIRITLSILILLTSPVMGSSLFILVKKDGHPTPIQLMSMDGDLVEVLIPGKGHRDLPREDCFALLRPEPPPTPRKTPRLHLRDGQVFMGHLAPTSSRDAIHWIHPWIGLLHVPLEKIDLVSLDGGPRTASREGYDQVILGNGDILHGFVTSVANGLEIELERTGGTQATRIPWSRVSSIDLFGAPVSPSVPRAWFMDGTIASFQDMNLGQDSWLTFSSHDLSVGEENNEPDPQPVREVHSIATGGNFMQPLPIQSPANPATEKPSTRPHAPFPEAMDPSAVLGLSPIEISGPISCSWSIPPGASRFRTRILLPASMQAWGNLELLILVDGVVLEQAHLSASSPMALVDIPVSGRNLTIRLTQGANGPVQDTVVLEYPMFLVSP